MDNPSPAKSSVTTNKLDHHQRKIKM
jgi:hypothetical protein